MSDSDSSSDPDSPPPPSSAECQARVEKFVSVVKGTDEAYAQMLLQRNGWDVERAVDKHFTKEAREHGLEVVVSTRAPEKIRLVSWNIDGLDARNREARMEAVCSVIQKRQAEIVFLQEVVPATLAVLRERLPRYQILPQDDGKADYFTAVLLSRFLLYLDSFECDRFATSVMGRGVQVVDCHVGKAKITLINTHLESTKDHAIERSRQLSSCFRRALSTPADRAVVLGGDLNLRDTELAQVGGISEGLSDLWEETGARPECRYTWDMTRNTNLEFPGKWKPRCRFDRLYLRRGGGGGGGGGRGRLHPTHFGLVGLEKAPGTQSFPSDHWGIEVAFKVDSN